jgi:hypothetical protein
MVFVGEQGIKYTITHIMIQVDMNLSFPVISEQDECGSSGPIEIGRLVVKFSHLE